MAMFFNGWIGYGTNVAAGVLAEPVDGGYLRRPFVLGTMDHGIVGDVGSGTVGPAVAAWGVIGYMGLFDAQVGGNLLLWAPLPVPIAVLANGTITSGTNANRLRFPDLQADDHATHLWPVGAPVARTADGRVLIAGVPLQVTDMRLAAQSQTFGAAVTMAALPPTQQAAGSGLLWNNGGIISVS